MQNQDFHRFLEALDDLNPAQIEGARTRIRDLRRKTEALCEIEARTNDNLACPFCGDERRQKWGRTRTHVQRYRCSNCRKTWSGRTGSAIGRIHRPDLFMVVLRDMLDAPVPQSVRKFARLLRLNKYTVWRWRVRVFAMLGGGTKATFSGIIEADETYQRESRKGSREWVRHFADPGNVPAPPRPRWSDYTTLGLPTKRGLSCWQLPILTVADRGGACHFKRLPNRSETTLTHAMKPLVPGDAVLCSDGAQGYATLAKTGRIVHVAVGNKPGKRVAKGCYHIQTVNSLHARYGTFIRPFCGPATKYLDGYIRWLEARLKGARPAEVMPEA